jgi:hypothetical protein
MVIDNCEREQHPKQRHVRREKDGKLREKGFREGVHHFYTVTFPWLLATFLYKYFTPSLSVIATLVCKVEKPEVQIRNKDKGMRKCARSRMCQKSKNGRDETHFLIFVLWVRQRLQIL